MKVHLDINLNQLAQHMQLHYLPAQIETNAEANVEKYFNVYLTNERDHLLNSLRGFPIDGLRVLMPPNLKGLVFLESQRTLEEYIGKLLRVNGTFENLTYWNYDKVSSETDGLWKAFEVLHVVDEISKSISDAEVKNEVDQKFKTE